MLRVSLLAIALVVVPEVAAGVLVALAIRRICGVVIP